jgi:hypothetical protein
MLASFQKAFPQRRVFNADNADDIKCFKKFLTEGRWSAMGCPFILEQPYISIPHMIQEKITKNVLEVE